MFDIPILGQRKAAPGPPPRDVDHPWLRDRSFLDGKGPRVAVEQRSSGAGVFAREQRASEDMSLARTIGEILHRHYRGHFWAVKVDSHQGVCLISIPSLMPRATHWILKLRDLANEADCLGAVMRAGGEILERYRIPTSSIDVGLGQFLEAKARNRAAKHVPG